MFSQYFQYFAIFCILKDLKRHRFNYISQLVTEKKSKRRCTRNVGRQKFAEKTYGIFYKRTFSLIQRAVFCSSDLSFNTNTVQQVWKNWQFLKFLQSWVKSSFWPQQQLQFWSNAFPVDFALYTCEIHTILWWNQLVLPTFWRASHFENISNYLQNISNKF